MSINISALTFSKINDIPFEIEVKESDYPVAPLVFAEDTDIKDHYRVRIIVFIPAEVVARPLFIVENDGKPCKVVTEGGHEVLARSFLLEYDCHSEKIPEKYTLWNVSVEYYLQDLNPVDYILTRLRNLDPKTSRGTVTTVQDA